MCDNAGKFTISAVGDICLSDHILCSGFGVASIIEKFGDDFIFQDATELLQDSDIVFGNLECVLAVTGIDKKNFKSKLFRGKPRYGSILKNAGFNVLNVANNHTMQHGPGGFNETVNVLLENSIHPLGLCGKGKSLFSSIPVFYEKKNICCALLGYSFQKDRFSPGETLYAQGNFTDIKNDILNLKNQADYVIISCHWGLEMVQYPSINTINIARQLIDFGADLVVGHHSHTLQCCETYKNKLILYSLGNFVFDLHWDESTRKTGIFLVKFSDGSISYQFSPYYIDRNYQPVPSQDHSIEHFDKNNCIIDEGDIEEANLSYYLMCNQIGKKLMYKKIFFLLKNLLRINKSEFFLFLKEKLFHV